MSVTRRDFLERLAAVGGFSAAYLGMEALGLLNVPPASDGRGRGRRDEQRL